MSQGKLDEAEPYYREALEVYRQVLGDEHPYTLTSINTMGWLLQAQGKLDEAEPLLLEGYTILESSLPGARRAQKLPPAIERLIKLYDAWGKPDKADEWRAKLLQSDEEKESSPETEGESVSDHDI